jgi:hypothetical protein
VSADVGRCLLAATWGHFPVRLCGVVHGRLVAGGVLGGDAEQLLERASKEVTLFALPWALLAVSGQHA